MSDAVKEKSEDLNSKADWIFENIDAAKKNPLAGKIKGLKNSYTGA